MIVPTATAKSIRYELLKLVVDTATVRTPYEMANTFGKSLSREGKQRWARSSKTARRLVST